MPSRIRLSRADVSAIAKRIRAFLALGNVERSHQQCVRLAALAFGWPSQEAFAANALPDPADVSIVAAPGVLDAILGLARCLGHRRVRLSEAACGVLAVLSGDEPPVRCGIEPLDGPAFEVVLDDVRRLSGRQNLSGKLDLSKGASARLRRGADGEPLIDVELPVPATTINCGVTRHFQKPSPPGRAPLTSVAPTDVAPACLISDDDLQSVARRLPGLLAPLGIDVDAVSATGLALDLVGRGDWRVGATPAGGPAVFGRIGGTELEGWADSLRSGEASVLVVPVRLGAETTGVPGKRRARPPSTLPAGCDEMVRRKAEVEYLFFGHHDMPIGIERRDRTAPWPPSPELLRETLLSVISNVVHNTALECPNKAGLTECLDDLLYPVGFPSLNDPAIRLAIVGHDVVDMPSGRVFAVLRIAEREKPVYKFQAPFEGARL